MFAGVSMSNQIDGYRPRVVGVYSIQRVSRDEVWLKNWYRSVRRRAHDAPDAILIADAADLAVGKIDFDHILRRADQAHGLVGMSVEYLGSVIAVLVGRDIGVVAFDVEGQPMRPVAA